MSRGTIAMTIGLVAVLALTSSAQRQGRREGRPSPMMAGPARVQSPDGPGLMPAMRLQEYADQLRTRSREAQELSDRLRREADELDQMAMRMMNRGPGRQGMQPMPGEDQQREMMKRQIERLRDEARQAKEQGRVEDSERAWKEADRLEQQLVQQGGPDAERQAIKNKIGQLRKEAQKAKEQGRMEDSKRLWEEADRLEQQLVQQRGPDAERQAIKNKIEELRRQAQQAKEQNRFDDADKQWKEADRLEQQLRGQGPREGGQFGKPVPPEVQDILRSAEQAEREGRMEDARRQREKAEIVARQFQEQRGQGPRQPGPQLKDELMRSLEQIKQEIGRLWQAVNEMRNRPRDARPT